MKRKRFSAVLGCVLALAILAGIAIPFARAAEETITFLNPLGKIEPLDNQPLAERLGDLNGKTVRLIYFGAANSPSQLVCRALGSMLQAEYPGVTISDMGANSLGTTTYDSKTAQQYDTWADGADAVILGVVEDNVGAWWISNHARQIEARGVPVVTLANSFFEGAVKRGAEDNGFAALRIVTIDRALYANAYGKATTGTPSPRAAYINGIIEGDVYARVEAALTAPTTEGEKSTAPLDAEYLGGPGVDEFKVSGTSYAGAVRNFLDLSMEHGFGDGLPLVIPTRGLVDELLATTDRAPDEVLGKIRLRGGVITVEKVAINAVMAGARPEHFPVILAAMEAYATAWEDNKLFYYPTLTSTEQQTVLMVVSGPIVEELDFGRGRAYDPGKESDAILGRAVRMCVRNIGHGSKESTSPVSGLTRINDHELFVVGESNEMLPEGWKTHSEMMGFPAGSNTVTLICVTQARLTGGVGGTASTTTLNSMRNSVVAGVPTIFAIPRTAAQIAASTDTRPASDGGFGTAALGIATKEAAQQYIANANRYNDALVWPIVAGFGVTNGGRAYNGGAMYAGSRGYQTQLIADKGVDPTAPSAPQNLDIDVNGPGTAATLSWSVPERGDVSKYQVSMDDGLTWIDVDAASTSFVFGGLVPGAQYFFRVRAVSDIRNSADIGLRTPGVAAGSDNPYEVKYAASGRGAWACATVRPERTPPASMKIDAAALATLRKNAAMQLAVTVAPENADPTVVWSSTNPAIAAVDENGLVTAVAIGTAVITAKTPDGAIASTVTIRVIA